MSDSLTKEARYDRAIALREEGKLKEATIELEKLALDVPDYSLAHLGLAVFYSKMERFDDSIREAAKACELEPENAFYFTALSSLAIKGGHHKEAEDALIRAQEIRFQAQMKKFREENPDIDEKLKEKERKEAEEKAAQAKEDKKTE